MNRIRQRTSVRAYETTPFDIQNLYPLMEECTGGVFGNHFKPEIYDSDAAKEIGINRFSSMGAITGNPAYILARFPADRLKLIDYGYCLEHLVLNLTEVGYGTCWLGMIPNKGKIERQLGVEDAENIPALISVGKAIPNKAWHQKLRSRQSKDRKRIDQLFYSTFIGSPIRGYQLNKYSEIFEAVQKSPSTMNKQPWRIVIDDNYFRFYMQADYITEHGLNLKYIDMGIVMCHFEIAAKSLGLQGYWMTEIIRPFDKYEYITSYVVGEKKQNAYEQ